MYQMVSRICLLNKKKKLRKEHLHQTRLKNTQNMHPEVIEIYS